ncbi:MAG: hypothetical protein A2816_01430 [Candidatus Yanofskybacteria bacterium RIFCSPHIGHO2_01_FULL_39_44]|nr:MAG: hypothetical protein A2816_01430 [Candidatus Yanofskybacteria bacterium RIFCSPHIGHO2_01_FULL_39_44]
MFKIIERVWFMGIYGGRLGRVKAKFQQKFTPCPRNQALPMILVGTMGYLDLMIYNSTYVSFCYYSSL